MTRNQRQTFTQRGRTMRKTVCLLLLGAMSLLVTACNERDAQPGMSVHTTQSKDDFDVVCVNGYQFLLFHSYYYKAGGLTQIWEQTTSGPRPAQCQPARISSGELPQPRNSQ